MSERYIQVPVGKDTAYVLASSIDTLKKVDAAIFDCDGVLIDTRQSYRKSIVETAKYFILELTDVELPSDETLRKTTHLLKKSGGFNNDWDATYALLLFLFSKLPKDFQNEFSALINSEKIIEADTLRQRFDYIRKGLKVKPKCFTIDLDELAVELERYAKKVDESGVASAEREFINSESKTIFLAVKRFLGYPGEIRESLLATVFDEMFYGQDLFDRIYGRKRQFYDHEGFVESEKEQTLVTINMLEELARAIGTGNFGIVSGRDRLSARYSLGSILDKFRSEAVLFLMDSNYQKEQIKEKQMKLKKPNPYPLLKAAKGLEQFEYSLYIGDSAEDLIMVKRANEIDNRFISVGVYALSDFKDELISNFFELTADIIVYSIKELPSVMQAIKVKS